MFTQNYIEYRKMMFLGKESDSFVTHSGSTTSGEPLLSAIGDFGYAMNTARLDAPRDNHTYVLSNYTRYSGVRFGTGSRPPARNDYALEKMLTSGISITNGNLVLVNNKKGIYSYVASFLVKNTSESELNIWEIGYYGHVCYGSYTYSDILFERTVLDKPITILPGETRAVEYRITFNQTLNVE